jgi:hypothetical protein
MIGLLPVLSVAIAAFCVWGLVRIINWRKRQGWRFWACVVAAFVAGGIATLIAIYLLLITRAINELP